MNFDWQTDERDEERWEDQLKGREESPSPRRRRWLALFLTLLLIVSAAFFLYREGRQRIEESAARLEADVLSSHELAQKASQQADLELFSTLLSGRVPAWTEAQKERATAGVLFGQTGRVLDLEPVPGEPPAADVTFSSDLLEATVLTPYPYIRPGGPVSETVILTHTAVYRKGTNSWLLSPPLEESGFWGNARTREREYLVLTYVQRDETLALRLAGDLDQKIDEMCHLLLCPDEYQVRLRLSHEPESVLSLLDPENDLTGRTTMVLPTPSLVGVPATDVAYEVLFQGYARRLLLPLLVERQEWECCRQVLFHQALLYRQLTALGVLPPEAIDVDYLHFPNEWPSQEALQELWRDREPATGPEDIPPAVYAALDFLLEKPIGTLFSLQRSLQEALRQWMIEDNQNGMEDDWVDFIQEQVAQAQQQIPFPAELVWPEQQLVLTCQTPGNTVEAPRSYVVRYDPATEQWVEEMDFAPGSLMMAVLPGDDGYFLSQQRFAQGDEPGMLETTLHRVGEEPILVAGAPGTEREMVAWPLSDPAGERMMVFFVRAEEDDSLFALVDPDDCTEAGCSYEPLPGFPVWSPDGRQLLAMAFEDGQIVAQKAEDATEWEEVGEGISPFWVDRQTFGFIYNGPRPTEVEVWLGVLGGSEPRPWLTGDLLMEALPGEDSPFRLEVYGAFSHPLSSDHFLLLASGDSATSELFVVGKTPDTDWLASDPQIRHLARLPARPAGLPAMDGMVEPGRPWVVMPLSGPESGLWLYNLASDEVVVSTARGPGFYQQSYDWSADRVWLARPAGGAIDLMAPEYQVDGRPYRHFVFHDYGACTSLGWLNRSQQ